MDNMTIYKIQRSNRGSAAYLLNVVDSRERL